MRRLTITALLTIGLFAAACGSEEVNLLSADGTEDDSNVAEDSAPIEAEPGRAATAEEYPFLDYFEFDARPRRGADLGQARFVLLSEDGDFESSGSLEFPVFSFVVSGWNGVDEPVATTILYTNFALENDELQYPQCGFVYAEFKRFSTNTYSVVRNQLPDVEGTALAWAGEGCDEYAPIEREEIFDGPIEVAFGEGTIVITSADGRTWDFTQVPYALPIWD